jgi:hypothetical protein
MIQICRLQQEVDVEGGHGRRNAGGKDEGGACRGMWESICGIDNGFCPAERIWYAVRRIYDQYSAERICTVGVYVHRISILHAILTVRKYAGISKEILATDAINLGRALDIIC